MNPMNKTLLILITVLLASISGFAQADPGPRLSSDELVKKIDEIIATGRIHPHPSTRLTLGDLGVPEIADSAVPRCNEEVVPHPSRRLPLRPPWHVPDHLPDQRG